MHPYFSQFTQNDTLWSPPPNVDDPAWIHAFESASERAKRNIANNWLWLLNKELTPVANTLLIAEIGKYTEFYPKVVPYIDSTMFATSRLRGSFDEFKRDMHNVNEPHKLFSLIKECWFSEQKDIESFRNLYSLFISQNVFAKQETRHYYPVFQKLLWNQVAANTHDDADWLELAVLMSTQCGLDSIDPADSLGNYVDDQRSLAWQKLGYLVRYSSKESRQDKMDWPLLPIISTTDSVIAVKAFERLLEFALRGLPDTIPTLKPGTILNVSKKELTNVYPMLREFIPTLTPIWDSAESLDMPYILAFESFLDKHANNTVPPLPDDLNYS